MTLARASARLAATSPKETAIPRCPQCAAELPTRGLFNSAGLKGLACPGCGSRLVPARAHSFVLYALTGAVAATVGYFLRRTDVAWWLKLAVPTATWLAGWHFVFSRFLRFRADSSAELPSAN